MLKSTPDIKKLSLLYIIVLFAGLFLVEDVDAAPTLTSGWETENALVEVTPSWTVKYFALPYLAYNLKGDGRWTLISGREAYGGYFGYYWDGTQWVVDSSLVNGLSAHGWYEAPALAYNVMGDNKWTLVGHQGSNFYGYYWDGIQWVEDSSRVNGLSVSGRTSHVLLENLNGDGKWYLITGTEEGTFRAFSWEGIQWIEDSSKVNGLPDIGRDSRVTAGFNITGNNKWTLIAVNYLDGIRGFNWDNTQSKWVEDDSEKGLPQDIRQMAPSLSYNLRGDGKWVLISGYTKNNDMMGFMFDSVDIDNLSSLENVRSYKPLATTVHINFTYPRTWNYRIKYSTNPDMSSALWSDWITDEDNVDYKLRYLQPDTTYYYQVYAYVPWDTNYYTTNDVKSFNTNPAQSYIFVNPGESIQDAIETLPLEGGTVELGEGTFTVNDTVRIWDDNITLKGQGMDKTIIEGDKIYVSRYDDFFERVAWLDSHGFRGKEVYDYFNASPEDFILNVKINNLTFYNPVEAGIRLLEVWNNEISDIRVNYDLGSSKTRGVLISSSGGSVIQNSIFERVYLGIQLDRVADVDVINNTVMKPYFEGIYYNNFWSSPEHGPTINRGNKIINATSEGMFIYFGTAGTIIEDNTVEGSGRYGIYLSHGNNYKVIGNIIRNNPDGIFIFSKDGEWLAHEIRENLIYNNIENGIVAHDYFQQVEGSQNITIVSNTIYGNGKDGLYNPQNHIYTLKNNIIANNSGCGLSGSSNVNSNYNLIYGNGQEAYCGGISYSNDIYVDPLFAAPANGDFHLKSYGGRWNDTAWVTDSIHSLAIDAGDPGSDHSNEPSYPNGRINLGAYGNTVYASKSRSASSTGTVTGQVTETNGSAISGAAVSIGSRSNTTNSTGGYVLSDVPWGNFTITASMVGYYDNSTGINVVANSTTIKNIVLTHDEEPPDITFFPPTPEDGDNVSNNYIYIDVSLSEAADWIALEWNGTNESMQGTDTSWYRNMTGLANGQYSFKVWANDSAGNMNVSETRSVTVNYVSSIDTDPPSIAFTNQTPVNGTVTGDNHVYINTSISDESGVSSFIDWNRSLAGHWRFEEDAGSGSTSGDSSPNGNNGTIHGAVSSDGKFGKALNFDGNDYIEIENPDLNLVNEITIEAWVKPIIGSRSSIAARYVYNYNIPVNDRSFELSISSSGNVEFALSSNGRGNGTTWLTSNRTVNDNAWNHIVATSDGTTMTIYINGVLDPETASAPSIIHSPDRPMQIGAWIYGVANETDNEYFNGIIDEVKIHSRSLSQHEINASYDSKLYNLERNFTSLDNGNYSYYACAQDTAGNYNCTETRVVTVRLYSQPLFEGWNNITEFIGYNNTPVESCLSSVDYTIIWELDDGSNSTRWSHVKGVGGDFSNLTSGEAYRIYVNSNTTWTYPVP